jgi:hypothetical protein
MRQAYFCCAWIDISDSKTINDHQLDNDMDKMETEAEASSSTGPHRMRITAGGQVSGYVNFALTFLKVYSGPKITITDGIGEPRPSTCPAYPPFIQCRNHLEIRQSFHTEPSFARYAKTSLCGRKDQAGIYGLHQYRLYR